MLPLNKVELTAYRYSGLVGSSFTLCQSIIWLILSIAGAICKYSSCGSKSPKSSFAYCFYLTYFYEPQNSTDHVIRDVTRVNYVSPASFNAIMWFSAFLSTVNIVVSFITLKEFMNWTNARYIKIMAKIWPVWIICLSCIELILCSIFIYDIMSINWKEDEVKCFMKTNLGILRSAYMNEHQPAPYLLQLKSNLQTMKKKVKRMKKKLQFLNTIVDMKSPDYLKNPFISQKLATDYVGKIWNSMFNNDIRETKPNKTDISLSDESLKHFLVNEKIHLDDVDKDLLKNFDGLTNIEYIKPIKSSNVVFGKQYDLSPNISLETPSIIDDLANLFLLHFKESDEKLENNAKLNQTFESFFENLIEKLKDGELDMSQVTLTEKNMNYINSDKKNHSYFEDLIELPFNDEESRKSQNQINATHKTENSTFQDMPPNYINIDKIFYDFFENLLQNITNIEDKNVTSENNTKYDKKFDVFFEDFFEKFLNVEAQKTRDKINTKDKIETATFYTNNSMNFNKKNNKDLFDNLKKEETLELQNKIETSKSANGTKFNKIFQNFIEELFSNLKNPKSGKSYDNVNENSTFHENLVNNKTFDQKIYDFYKKLFGNLENEKSHESINKTNIQDDIETSTFHENSENNTTMNDFYEEILKNDKTGNKFNITDQIESSTIHESSENNRTFNQKFDDIYENLFGNLSNEDPRNYHNNNNNKTGEMETSFHEKSGSDLTFNQTFDNFLGKLFGNLKPRNLHNSQNEINRTDEMENLSFHENSGNNLTFNEKFDRFYEELFGNLKPENSHSSQNEINKTNEMETVTFNENSGNNLTFNHKVDNFYKELFGNLKPGNSRNSQNKINKTDEMETLTFHENSGNNLTFNQTFDDFYKEMFGNITNGESDKNGNESYGEKSVNYTEMNKTYDSSFGGFKSHKFHNKINNDNFDGNIDDNENQIDDFTTSISDQSKDSLIKEILKKHCNKEIDEEEMLRGIKEALNNSSDLNNYDEENFEDQQCKLSKSPSIITTTTNYKPIEFQKRKHIESENDLVSELCENCSAFVLGPSILCMLMSIKYVLIWILNISLAILTLYYDSLIEIRRKSFGFN